MDIRKILALLFCAGVAFGTLASCKDDDEDDTTPSLNGSLSFYVPDFAAKGDVVTTGAPSGLYRDGEKQGVGISYAWYVSEISTVKDTTKRADEDPALVPGNYTFTVPDSLLTTLTVTCVASSEGYYSTTAYSYCTIVDPDESLVRAEFGEESMTETDERDGKTIRYMTVGELDWMQVNCAYAGAGIAYAEYEPLTDLYGRYYTWDEAMSNRPDGWRLPTVEEYKALCGGSLEGAAGSLMDRDAAFNGSEMWEWWPDVNPDNSRCFYAMPTGFAMKREDGYEYEGNYSYAMWWTADEESDEMATAVYLYEEEPDVLTGGFSKSQILANVRYVRDSQ